jgi:protein-disulfide isomerase
MFKVILVSLGIAIGAFLFLVLTGPEEAQAPQEKNDSTARSEPSQNTADTASKPKLIIGDENAPVTIVEYGDFKCPSCNQFHHTAGAELRNTYISEGTVNIEFRNYPFLGPDSGRAARGSYCAHDQGVFTAYHDNVYNYLWDEFYTQDDIQAEFRDVLTSDKLAELAGDGLRDRQLFIECVNSTEYNKYIDADLELGANDGITGTPGFTVAGRKINGPSNFNTFKTLIDIELGKL